MWGRWAIIILAVLAGLGTGIGLAIATLRSDSAQLGIDNGPWRTAENIGTRQAGLVTKAVIALRGLLALPDSEALYYNASVDSAGEALDGACHYRVSGGRLPARWWSVTAYGKDAYLITNPAGLFSVGSAGLSADQQDGWAFAVGPDNRQIPGSRWIPTRAGQRFELTLRAYHPDKTMLDMRATIALPVIEKLGCPS